MKKKPASKLAQEYELESETAYYGYLVESYRNGQKQQFKNLFDRMEAHSQHNFVGYLETNWEPEIMRYLTRHLIDVAS